MYHGDARPEYAMYCFMVYHAGMVTTTGRDPMSGERNVLATVTRFGATGFQIGMHGEYIDPGGSGRSVLSVLSLLVIHFHVLQVLLGFSVL